MTPAEYYRTCDIDFQLVESPHNFNVPIERSERESFCWKKLWLRESQKVSFLFCCQTISCNFQLPHCSLTSRNQIPQWGRKLLMQTLTENVCCELHFDECVCVCVSVCACDITKRCSRCLQVTDWGLDIRF